MAGKDIRGVTQSLGFGDYIDVRSRHTVADVFRPDERSGLYALYFENGEGYVGRSIDIVRRYCGHRTNHDDIAELAFRPLAQAHQDSEERAAISACEAAGVHLRNIQFVSIVSGETDLDLILPRDEQVAWQKSNARVTTFPERPNDEGLRRRYEKRFSVLEERPQWPALRSIIKEYAATCIPKPDRTEMSFWSVSCLSGRLNDGLRVLGRININWQEVMTFLVDDESNLPCFTFHVRASILKEKHFSPPWDVKLQNHYYAPGGKDQIKVVAGEGASGNTVRLIGDPAFKAAAKDFNLNLMRKGANVFANTHCFALADQILCP